jgi:hypothetical protein
MARADHALTVLAPLEHLDDAAPLKHFTRGLEALIKDEFAPCIGHLRKGVELNRDNEPLNRDMTMLIDRVNALMDNAPETTAPTEPPAQPSAEAEAEVRTDFSLYRTQN